MNSLTDTKQVAIIGLGPMGQAMTKAFLKKDHTVKVWNRTEKKMDAMVREGAVKTNSLSTLLQSSELIILSLTNYEVMYQLFDPVRDQISGKVLVNLSSDTPKKAREAAIWANGLGAAFLAGGVMVDPPLVGTPEAFIFYSGSKEVFEQYQSTLAILGEPDYLRSDYGLAPLFYQGLLDIMFTSISSILHAIALLKSSGISAATFMPYVHEMLASMPHFIEGMADEVDQGYYNGDMNNMNMMAAGMDHIFQASKDAGIDTTLPGSIKEIYDQAVLKGHGKEGLSSIIEVLSKKVIPGMNKFDINMLWKATLIITMNRVIYF